MATIQKIKVKDTLYDISPSPSGTLDTTTKDNAFASSDVAQASATTWTDVATLLVMHVLNLLELWHLQDLLDGKMLRLIKDSFLIWHLWHIGMAHIVDLLLTCNTVTVVDLVQS